MQVFFFFYSSVLVFLLDFRNYSASFCGNGRREMIFLEIAVGVNFRRSFG
jgi:hypothetical protein